MIKCLADVSRLKVCQTFSLTELTEERSLGICTDHHRLTNRNIPGCSRFVGQNFQIQLREYTQAPRPA